jgi:hypothetical protein
MKISLTQNKTAECFIYLSTQGNMTTNRINHWDRALITCSSTEVAPATRPYFAFCFCHVQDYGLGFVFDLGYAIKI